jgi:ADP-glucose pyrophosphorylase
MKKVKSAFILAAGKGTRLRPLTEKIPKPLLPVFHKPLMTFALDHCIALDIENIAINTCHLYEAFYDAFQVQEVQASFGLGHYEGRTLTLFHENPILETGGALRNARSVLEQGTFLVHNGDILTDAPLQDLIDHHIQSKSMVTLLLRHEGAAKNVAYNVSSGEIEGFSGTWNALPSLATKNSLPMVYTGIAVMEPSFLDWIPIEGPSSMIPAFIKAIEHKQKVGGFLLPHNYFWSDLGTPASYLQTHLHIAQNNWRPPYKLGKKHLSWPQAIHPSATIDSSAKLDGMVVVGAHTHIAPGAHLKNCVILPRTSITQDAHFSEMILSPDISY